MLDLYDLTILKQNKILQRNPCHLLKCEMTPLTVESKKPEMNEKTCCNS